MVNPHSSANNFFRYSRWYLERRTWRQRVSRAHQNWEPILPSLAKLYMEWKCRPLTQPSSPITVDTPSAATPPNNPSLSDFSFNLEVLNIYTLDETVRIPCTDRETPIQALIKSGYLGNTPVTPTLAISLRTLELFRRIRLRKSSFSVEAFTKVICDLYSVGHYPQRS